MDCVDSTALPVTHKAHVRSKTSKVACQSAIKVNSTTSTEVSHCDPNGNSWCCAGAAGQGLGGPTYCDTSLTTSLEPYPFSAIDRLGQSTAAGTSVFSTATPSTSSPSSGTISTAVPTAWSTTAVTATTIISPASTSAPTALSTTAFTPSASLISLTSSLAPTVSQTTTTVPTSSAQPPPARQNNDATMEIAVGVLLAIIVVFLGVFAFFIYQNNRKHKLGLVHSPHEIEAETLPYTPEMDGDGTQLVAELDITHYELKQPDTPRHELG